MYRICMKSSLFRHITGSDLVCHEDQNSWGSVRAVAKNIFLIERFYVQTARHMVSMQSRFSLLEGKKRKINKGTVRGYGVSLRNLCISCFEGSSIFSYCGVQHCFLQFQTRLKLSSCWAECVMHWGLFFHMQLQQLNGFVCWAWPSEEQA